jgi:hypothetical protein
MTYYLLHYGLRFLIAFGLTFAVLRRIWPAAFIGAAIVALIDVSQLLWVHAAGLTFAIVEWLLSPLLALHADPVARIIGTDMLGARGRGIDPRLLHGLALGLPAGVSVSAGASHRACRRTRGIFTQCGEDWDTGLDWQRGLQPGGDLGISLDGGVGGI